MTTFEAVIIAIVEGITEFLPISSTGHMIVTSSLLGIHDDDFTKLFEICIQLGAILAVVALYWKKFFVFDRNRFRFYVKLLLATLPALLCGYLFHSKIKAMMGHPGIVVATMLLGGIVLLFADNWFKKPEITSDEQVDHFRAIRIGFFQCISLIPGVSRSAATIIGGMQQKLTRSAAAEFSFFLAVPTMFAATCYDLLKDHEALTAQAGNLQLLVTGFIIAFVVAVIAIKFFIGLLKKYGFRVWGIYRIIAGIILLILIYNGYIHG
ncbi:MAG TPA: undecaprenyl-diphosphate phosphatase [Chitinophagaceae bacterium]|nr:undecaprenyl-diphosphate phosphatase [Chitinophagaceae bacterium]